MHAHERKGKERNMLGLWLMRGVLSDWWKEIGTVCVLTNLENHSLVHVFQEWQQAVKDLLAQLQSEDVDRAVPEELSTIVTSPVYLTSPAEEAVNVHEVEQEAEPQGGRRAGIDNSTRSRIKTLRQSAAQQSSHGRLPKLLEEVLLDHEARIEAPEKTWWMLKQEYLSSVVDSSPFEYATGILILINIVLIGVEEEMKLRGNGHHLGPTNRNDLPDHLHHRGDFAFDCRWQEGLQEQLVFTRFVPGCRRVVGPCGGTLGGKLRLGQGIFVAFRLI